MASGDTTVVNQYKEDIGNEIMDMDGDVYKLGLVTSTLTPTAALATPHWGGTGTTNYATNEVTPGGNYAAGGPTLASVTWNESGGTVTWNAADVSILQHASNPTNARWAIIYNNTDVNKRVVAFVDLGSVRDLSGGDFTITWHVNGIFQLT